MQYINTGKSSQIAQTAISLHSAGGQLTVSSAANNPSFFATLYNMKIKRRLSSSEENRISCLGTHSISVLEHFQLHTEPSFFRDNQCPLGLEFHPHLPDSASLILVCLSLEMKMWSLSNETGRSARDPWPLVP